MNTIWGAILEFLASPTTVDMFDSRTSSNNSVKLDFKTHSTPVPVPTTMCREKSEKDKLLKQWKRLGEAIITTSNDCFKTAVKVLASGSEGVVLMGHTKDGEKVVYKVAINSRKRGACNLREEAQILKKLGPHQQIIELKDDNCFVDGYPAICLEMAEGGDMLEYIPLDVGLEETNASIWFAQMVITIAHIHKHGYIHGDIKPDNTLIMDDGDRQWIALADFGMVTKFCNTKYDEENQLALNKDELVKPPRGTVQYAPPEVLVKGTTMKRKYLPCVDVFELATTLYVMLHGAHPFKGETKDEVLKSQLHDGPKFKSSVSEDAKDLMKAMLKIEYKSRITVPEILAHPFLSKPLRILGVIDPTSYLRESGFHSLRLTKTPLKYSMDSVRAATSDFADDESHKPESEDRNTFSDDDRMNYFHLLSNTSMMEDRLEYNPLRVTIGKSDSEDSASSEEYYDEDESSKNYHIEQRDDLVLPPNFSRQRSFNPIPVFIF